MTSNLGSHYLLQSENHGGTIEEPVKEQVMSELRSHFRPEFLNRVDDIILFKPLSKSDIEKIVNKMIFQLQERIEDQHLMLMITDEAKEFIADQGYDPVYGARPLKRFIQKQIETKLAREIIAGKVSDQQQIVFDYDGDKIFIA